MENKDLLYENLSYEIIGAAMDVHKKLGPGFLEAVYHETLGIELEARNIPFESEKELKINYRGKALEKTYKADMVIDKKIIVEIKAMAKLTSLEESQVLNYLKCTGHKLGLLINFGSKSLEWKRLVF